MKQKQFHSLVWVFLVTQLYQKEECRFQSLMLYHSLLLHPSFHRMLMELFSQKKEQCLHFYCYHQIQKYLQSCLGFRWLYHRCVYKEFFLQSR